MMRWNREAAMLGIPDLPEEGFKHVGDRKIKPQGGGGGSSGTQTVEQTNVPSWARPQFEDMLGRGIALSEAEYQPYTGQRQADFTQMQQQAFQQAGQQGVAGQIGQASGLAGLASLQGLQAGRFQTGSFNPMSVQAPSLQQFQMGPAMQVGAQRVGTQGIQGAQTGFNPALQAFQMGPAQEVSSRDVGTQGIQAAQTGFRPDLQTFQMDPAQQVSSRDVGTQGIQAAQTAFRPDLSQFQMRGPESFTQAGTAEQFMSPYMQNVVDIQQREAQRQADIAGTQRGAQAVRAGAFGGSRQAILDAEAQRNLAQQMGDIQATGSQAAFQQAQQQFNQEQQARQAAEQANLQARLGVQELGTQTGLQTSLANLNAEQQARVQSEANRLQAQGMNQEAALRSALANQQAGLTVNQQNLAARLGVQELGTQAGLQTALANLNADQQARVQSEANRLQAQGMNQEAALRSALANQQAGLTVGQQNLASQLGVQQLGTQTGLQTALANLNNEQQARVQSEANRLQAQGMNQEAALRSALANQQAGLTVGQQNLAAQLGIQQLGTGQSMQAQMANQNAFLEAQRMLEQSRQFGADLGLRGGAQALQGAQTLGQLGQQQFGQEMDILGLQRDVGREQQMQEQQRLDQQFADFQAQRDFDYQQLGFISDLLRGAGSSTRSMYSTPQPGAAQTLAGLGMAGAGLGGLFAKGGEVKGYADGGITGLLGDQELAQTAQNPAHGPMMQMAAQDQMAQNAALRGAAPQGMPQPMPEEELDPIESALVVEMQKAMAEGDREAAEVIARRIEARREERAMQEQMGLAGMVPDQMAEGIPEGGIMGMAMGGEVQRFQTGGTPRSPYRPRWMDALDEMESEPEESSALARALRRGFLYSSDVEKQRAEGRLPAPAAPQAAPTGIEQVMPAPEQSATDTMRNQSRAAQKAAAQARAAEQRALEEAAASEQAAGPAGIAALQRGTGFDTQAAMAQELGAQQGIAAGMVQGADDAIAAQEAAVKERGVFGEAREKRLKEQEEGLESEQKKARSMALLQAGLSILSADPSRGALAAIGSGALEGLGAYKGDLKDLEKRRERILDKMDEIEDIRRREAMADGKERRELVAQRNKAIVEGQKLMATTLSRFTDIDRDEAKFTAEQTFRASERALDRAALAERNVGTAEERATRDAEAAFQRDPEAAAIRKRLESPFALDPAAQQRDLDRLREIQADKYRQFGVTMTGPTGGADMTGFRMVGSRPK